MVKEQFIELISKYVPDGEELAVGGWWSRADAEQFMNGDKPFTDEQWARFVFWFEKYQDSSGDADEAFVYAMKEEGN